MPHERFVGPDMNTLLGRAQAKLGPDAVVISCRRLPQSEGAAFELIAGPFSAPRAREGRNAGGFAAALDRAGERLSAGTEPESTSSSDASTLEPARRARFEATPSWSEADRRGERPRATAARLPRPGFGTGGSLTTMTPLVSSTWRRRMSEAAVVALVGPTGSGKTTTIAKLARHPAVFGALPVGLLCLDTYRIGAVEQSRIYAEIARLPLAVAYDSGEIPRALRTLKGCEVILVDTPGRGPGRKADHFEIREQLERLMPVEVHLTLPAGLKAEHARRILEEHRPLGVTHVIATKVDEFAGDTTVFDLASDLGLPMRWFTDGQEVPMDLKSAAPDAPGVRATPGFAEAR